MNMIATVVGVSLLLALCEAQACHYKNKTCTEFAALGDKFTVTFGRLDIDSCCSSGLQFITDATIKSANSSKKSLTHNSTNFWVTFTPENTTHGSHWYTLTYSYRCDPLTSCLDCSCRQHNIKLHLRIAAFQLQKNVVEEQLTLIGDNIEFLSSSGLSTNNIKVKFQFTPENLGARKKTATCEPDMTEHKQQIGNWKIFRLNTTNECCLVVENATSADSGSYEAIGVLHSDDGRHIYAYSNFVVLRIEVQSGLFPAEGKSDVYILIVAMIATLVLIIVALIFVFIGYRYRHRRPRHPYVPVPVEEQRDYGTLPRSPLAAPPPNAVADHRNVSPPTPSTGTTGSTGRSIDTPIHTSSSADPQGGGPTRREPTSLLLPPMTVVRSAPPPVMIPAGEGPGFESEEDRPDSLETVVAIGDRTPILSPQQAETLDNKESGQPLDPRPLPTITETPNIDVPSTGKRPSPVTSEHSTTSDDSEHQRPNDRTSLQSFTGQSPNYSVLSFTNGVLPVGSPLVESRMPITPSPSTPSTEDSPDSSLQGGQPSDTSSNRSNGSDSPGIVVSSEHSSMNEDS